MKQLEEKLGYKFKDPMLLKNALTHSSYANENRAEGVPSNERLEFLGDSVLGFVTAKHLYNTVPTLPEGKMTRLRAELVCEHSLYGVAQELELGAYLRMGHGEEKNGGRERASILADATEAVIAPFFSTAASSLRQALLSVWCSAPRPLRRTMRPTIKPSFRSLCSASPTGF